MKRVIAVLIATLACASSAMAQTWPTRPVTLVVAWPPGSGIDVMARIVSDQLSRDTSRDKPSRDQDSKG